MIAIRASKVYNYLNDKDKKPIILSRNILALITLYERQGCDFLIMPDSDEDFDFGKIMEESADEFVRQLKDRWCTHFMVALRRAIKKEMDRTDRELGLKK